MTSLTRSREVSLRLCSVKLLALHAAILGLALVGWPVRSEAQTLTATVTVQPGDGSTFPTDPPLTWDAHCFYAPPYPTDPPLTGPNPWNYAFSPAGWWYRRCANDLPVLTPVSIEPDQASFGANVSPNDSRYLLTHTGGTTAGSNVWKLWAREGTAKGTVTNIDGSPAPGVPVAALSGPLHSLQRSMVTNSLGQFDFTETDALSQLNHWGLDVDEKLNGAAATVGGERSYYFVAGVPGDPSVPRYGPDARFGLVESSKVTTVALTVRKPEKKKDVDNKTDKEESRPPAPERDKCENQPPQPPRGMGQPVNLFTGNVYFSQTDVVLPGLARTLALDRTYNSHDALNGNVGAFGRGWTFSLEKTLTLVPDTATLIRLVTSDGSPIYYADPDGDLTYRAVLPASEQSWLVRTGTVFTRHFVEGDRESFDDRGLLTAQVDRWGHETALAHDPDGRLTSITLPGGRSLTFSYSGNQVSEVLGPTGSLATYSYSGDLLSEVTYPDGSGYTFDYDGAGKILSVTDRSGRVLETHTYDSLGRAVTSEVGGGRERLTFAYQDGRTLVTDALGKTTTYLYAGSPRQVFEINGPCQTCGGGGETQRWGYDLLGRITSYTNGAAETTTYTYDPQGFVATITDALNRTTSFTRDSLGRVLTKTRPGAVVTTWTHGPAGPLTITDASGRTTQIGYNAAGLVESVTDPAAKATTFSYNAHGDLVSMADPLGHTTTFTYDEMGRRTGITDPMAHTTSTSYDTRGRVTSVILADGSHTDLAYDQGGRLVTVTDALGRVTRRSYDSTGALASVEDPLQGVTRYGYDVMFRLTSLADARGHVTRFEYDGDGHLVRQIFPDGKDESYQYTAGGRLAGKTDRRGILTYYSYDEIGRLVEQTFSDGTPTIRRSYDAAGRIETAENGSDSLTWSYDPAGRILTEHSQAANATVAYVYDVAGRRSSAGLEGSPATAYGYDDAGRLTGLTRGALSFTLGYDDADRRTSLSFPNGVATSYSYDLVNRLTAISASSGAASIASVSYTHDAAGNRTSKSSADMVEQYAYDALDRLSHVDRPSASSERSVFTYDPVGNRTASQTGTSLVSATYLVGNRLTSEAVGGPLLVRGSLNEPAGVSVNGQPARMLAGNTFEATVPVVAGTNVVAVVATDGQGNARTSSYEIDVAGRDATYSYDPAGNLTAKTEGGESWTYEWNALNQLVRVGQNGIEIARFVYDPRGRRIQKVAGGVTTAYVYDEEDILKETRSDGTVLTFVHGPGIDEPLARTDATGATEYYHADGLGSIVKTTDAAGAIALTRQYDAWGRLELGAEVSGFAFTGREWDSETGLYYFRARYYDAELGRFINEDPIGFEGGDPSFYTYVGSNPVDRVDPFGLQWLPPLDSNRVPIPKPRPVDPTGSIFDESHAAERRNFNGFADPYGGGFRHCMAACLAKRRYGPLGNAMVNAWDLAFEGSAKKDTSTNSASDMAAEQHGLQCADKNKRTRSCEQECLDIYLPISRGGRP